PPINEQTPAFPLAESRHLINQPTNIAILSCIALHWRRGGPFLAMAYGVLQNSAHLGNRFPPPSPSPHTRAQHRHISVLVQRRWLSGEHGRRKVCETVLAQLLIKWTIPLRHIIDFLGRCTTSRLLAGNLAL
ncbi:hypothetical protein BO78DRAFT_450112, partial [Aspergillus sclerotiicarbonarius CBS 121057]